MGFSRGISSSTGQLVDEKLGELIIETITLDRIIKKNSVYPDFIKIDVEGHGDKVLEGFSILQDYPKKINILMELHSGSYEFKYIMENFYGKGYEIKDLNGNILNQMLTRIPTHVIISNNTIIS